MSVIVFALLAVQAFALVAKEGDTVSIGAPEKVWNPVTPYEKRPILINGNPTGYYASSVNSAGVGVAETELLSTR